MGAKFRRQHPIGPFIVDFVCIDARLIIEVDGGQHHESQRDRRRDDLLRGRGFLVLRFWDNEVLQNTEAVLEEIWMAIGDRTPSPPAPLPQAGEG